MTLNSKFLFNNLGLLPWTKCDAWWNTEHCRTPGEWANFSELSTNKTNVHTVASTVEYWEYVSTLENWPKFYKVVAKFKILRGPITTGESLP